MVELKAISYEESRLEYFRKQRDSAKRRMNYWCGAKQANRVGWMEASDRASEASAQYNFYKDALEALAAQPKWISVEDRLPGYNAGMRFIVSRDDGTVCEGLFEVSNGRWYEVTTDGLWEIEVTHWMPLPSTEGIE